jgi:hypothetical protein
MPSYTWLATVECVNGTRVKIHDKGNGFLHGYLVNMSMPQCWTNKGEIVSNTLTPEYNLVMETYKEFKHS